MNRFLKQISLTIALFCTIAAAAQLPITPVEMIMPDDMVFMDMALEAASASKKMGGIPDGAVIVQNGNFRASGRPTAGKTAVESAVAKSHLQSLDGCVIYCINQPSTADVVALSQKGILTIYFVNSGKDVAAAGLLPSSAFTDTTPVGLTISPMKTMEYPEAQKIIK